LILLEIASSYKYVGSLVSKSLNAIKHNTQKTKKQKREREERAWKRGDQTH